MTVVELLSTLTRIFFLVLSASTTVNYLHRRDDITRDIALVFGSVGLSVAISVISDFIPSIPQIITTVGILGLIAQPYLFVRLAKYLQPIPMVVMRAGLIGMLVSWACLVIFGSSLPLTILVIIGYFVVINVYVMVVFIRGTQRTSGVVHRRLQLCAWGSGLFALALLLIVPVVLVPALAIVFGIFVQLSATLSAMSFLLGFAPPRWLRRVWQFAELRNYHLRISQNFSAGGNDIYLLTELTQTANRAIGGSISMVIDTSLTEWQLIYSTDQSKVENFHIENDGVIQQVWQNKMPVHISKRSNLSEYDHNLINITQAETLLIVPINMAESVLAILLVFFDYGSLFPDDDIELLNLLVQQAGVFLENFHLTEQLRQQLEARFARVLETTAEAVITVDALQHIILFNASAERIFGYAADEVLGKTLEMLLPPDVAIHHHRFVSDFATGLDIARGMGERQRELSAKHKDGTIFPIEASISKLTEGDEVILTVFIRDITEQKRAEAIQREIETRFARVLETTAEAVISIDTSQHVILFNQSAERMFDYRADEVVGKTLEMLLPPDVARHHQQFIIDFATGLDIARGMGERQHELYAKRKDGSIFPIEASISKLTQNNQVILTVFIRDITEQKQAQEALHLLNQELEQRIEERTAHLAAVNKELEAFSYSVSHDLRAPLRALDGFSQALVEDYEAVIDEEGQEYLKLIRYESQRMGQLIDDLIDLSRFTRTELHRETVDLSAMVEVLAKTLQAQNQERIAKFVIQENLIACADSHLMQVALQNLLDNAWKYSSQQSSTWIEFGSIEDAEETLYFVRDNGVGFDMAYVHKLFGAFQRLHAATEYEGTGIGLATVQRIIHRHGGKIRAEGVINEGATFYFTLGDGNCD